MRRVIQIVGKWTKRAIQVVRGGLGVYLGLDLSDDEEVSVDKPVASVPEPRKKMMPLKHRETAALRMEAQKQATFEEAMTLAKDFHPEKREQGFRTLIQSAMKSTWSERERILAAARAEDMVSAGDDYKQERDQLIRGLRGLQAHYKLGEILEGHSHDIAERKQDLKILMDAVDGTMSYSEAEQSIGLKTESAYCVGGDKRLAAIQMIRELNDDPRIENDSVRQTQRDAKITQLEEEIKFMGGPDVQSRVEDMEASITDVMQRLGKDLDRILKTNDELGMRSHTPAREIARKVLSGTSARQSAGMAFVQYRDGGKVQMEKGRLLSSSKKQNERYEAFLMLVEAATGQGIIDLEDRIKAIEIARSLLVEAKVSRNILAISVSDAATRIAANLERIREQLDSGQLYHEEELSDIENTLQNLRNSAYFVVK